MAAQPGTMLAAQGALNSMADKFGGRTPVRIHFLDNSSKMFLLDEDTLAKDLIHTILDKFSVVDSATVVDYFGIFESLDGHNIGLSMNPEDKVVGQVKSWSSGGNSKVTESAKLVFMIRLFMPCLWGLEHKDVVALRLDKPSFSTELYLESASLRDEALIHLQYIQALYHIITSQYPTTEEQALTLGAYHFIFKFGNYKPDVHKAGFLGTRIVEFIPIKLLRIHDFDEWETKLLEHLKDFTAHDNHEKSVQRLYLEEAYTMAIFGSSFFRCNQKGAHNLPENIILGVQFDGMKLFDKNRKELLSFRIDEVLRWGFKPGVMFYFEVRPTPDMDGTLEFDSVDGKVISDLLTDYALAFIQEKSHEDERKLGEPSSTPSSAAEAAETAPSSELPTPPPVTSARAIVKAIEEEEQKEAEQGEDEDEQSEDEHDSHHEEEGQKEEETHPATHRVDEHSDDDSVRDEVNKHDAAILIQSTFRGHKGRVEVSHMIERMIEEGHFDSEGEEEGVEAP